MNAIELSHVCKHFPGFSIQDLTFAVPSGTICGLVGENGAGKSTTIRLLMGALRPDSGRCTVLGADSASPEFLSLKEDIGVVLDEAMFHDALTAAQVGTILRRLYRSWDPALFRRYLGQFSLPEKKEIKTFSRGMKMKLAIAAALSHHPKLLILDEATSALDSESEHMVQKALDNLMLNRTSLIIAHRLSTILEADRIVVMECGRIVDIGRHEELLGRCELYTRLYNMQFRAHENICGCETDLVES